MPADLIPASNTTTSVLALDGTAGTSSIDAPKDQDWWSVALTAGTAYTFRLNKAASSTLDPVLRLLDSTGKQLKTNDDASNTNSNSLVTFIAPTTGTYYLSAGGYKNTTGDYSITARAETVPGTTATTSVVTVNGAAGSSSIDAERDQDWWSVSLTEGLTYTFRLGATASSALDTKLRLLDSTGRQLKANDDSEGGTNSLITFTAAATGTYYLSAEGYRTSVGAYTLTATTDVVANSSATTSVLAVNEAAGRGSVDIAGDQDWWSVSLTAGTAYTFRLNKSGVSGLNPYLRLLDSTGSPVATDNDKGGLGNSLIHFTPGASGTYYLSAEGHRKTAGAYSLSAVSDVVPHTVATTSTVAVNGAAASGNIDFAGDQDWWSVALVQGGSYTFRLSNPTAAKFDGYLRLLDSAGNAIKVDNDQGGNKNALITYTATAAGTFYLSAEGHQGSLGAYSLSASAVLPSTTSAMEATDLATLIGQAPVPLP